MLLLMKAFTPIFVSGSKTAEFLSTLDTGLPDRSASQIAPRDPLSSTWVSGILYQVLGALLKSCWGLEIQGRERPVWHRIVDSMREELIKHFDSCLSY